MLAVDLTAEEHLPARLAAICAAAGAPLQVFGPGPGRTAPGRTAPGGIPPAC